MAERYDLLLKGGTAVTPMGVGRTDIAATGGRIAALGDLGAADAAETIDARGLHVLPGVIDTQVHFREPGLEHKEDLASGTAAAALGGVVAVFEMPNTSPSTTTAAAIRDKLQRAEGRAWTDHAFFMGSSTGNLLVEDDETLLRELRNGTRRVAVHAEDEARMRERFDLVRDGADVSMHPVWRDEITALTATRRLLGLARRAGRRVHVLHVTTADEVPLLAANKDLATMEVTPQHLTLSAPECYQRLGSKAQMNPPIREARHREALWQALRDGIVDEGGSDHAPHSLEEKAGDYPRTPSGMPGVQTLLPLLLDHLAAGRLTLERLVDLTSAGPQRIYGIAGKGRIAVGYDADFTLVDLGARREITADWLASKCGWSPFEGMTVTGWPKATVVRGAIVMREDELIGRPAGRPVRFLDSLAMSGEG